MDTPAPRARTGPRVRGAFSRTAVAGADLRELAEGEEAESASAEAIQRRSIQRRWIETAACGSPRGPRPSAWYSWSERTSRPSSRSARIALTVAAPPVSVVMHGTLFIIAARRTVRSSKNDSRPIGVLMTSAISLL